MPVTLVSSNLVTELRLAGGGDELEIANRLLGYATAAIIKHVGATAYAAMPDAVANEAAIRLVSWLYDVPTSGQANRYANPMRSSGAERELLPYRNHRIGLSA